MRSGGRYEVSKGGKAKRVEPPTKSHPEGDAPRDADGRRLDRPVLRQAQDEVGTKKEGSR